LVAIRLRSGAIQARIDLTWVVDLAVGSRVSGRAQAAAHVAAGLGRAAVLAGDVGAWVVGLTELARVAGWTCARAHVAVW